MSRPGVTKISNVGLVGNADTIVASDDAYFGVPEVDRGALGAATHLARLVPQHLMRTLYFTGRTIPAKDLIPHGSVLEVVPRDQLDDAAAEPTVRAAHDGDESALAALEDHELGWHGTQELGEVLRLLST